MKPSDPFISKLILNAASYSEEIQAEIIKMSLKMTSLNFIATFIKCESGPLVRTYFFEPALTSSLSIIFAKEQDIALALGVRESILISRDGALISIAVPRKDRELIRFDEALSNLFTSPKIKEMTLPILMGKDPRGEYIYLDLADQPHLLIAGATGGGKSIFTSQAICSMALRLPVEELEFHLCDTKQLDLVLFERLEHVKGVYRNIHDIRDVVNNLLDEVRLRTTLMSGHVRNIKEYNRLGNKYKYKVLIIDEFADVINSDREWMKTLPKGHTIQPIDKLVERLAAISRAAGIHIILATQRPSVKIISGEIKTNFPARIAFKLPSMVDSRVILDENGAEKLLGRGDYLYRISGSDSIHRAHGAFVEIRDIQMILSQHQILREQFQLA